MDSELTPKGKGGSRRSTKIPTTFTKDEVDCVYQYLLKYRDLSIYYVSSLSSLSNKPTTEVTSIENSDTKEIEESYHAITIIGGHEFPPLNTTTCTKPYLVLPSSLGSKHRKVIHELCSLDILGLFHDSVGPRAHRNTQDVWTETQNSFTSRKATTTTTHGRTMLLSIFVDGFQYHPEWKETSYSTQDLDNLSFPIMRCKSWYYLNHDKDSSSYTNKATHSFPTYTSSTSLYWVEHYNHIYSHLKSKTIVQEATSVGICAIRALLSQPETCLRENMDEVQMVSTQHNLSHCPKPCIDVDENSSATEATFLLVDTVEKMHQCIEELKSPMIHEIAFDLEAHNPSKMCQVTCLIQLSTNLGKDYVIDVLAPGVWDYVSLLKPIFANPSIVKVGHNIAALDIPSLHRDFGIMVVNAFDTQVAAESLRLHGNFGLSKLCEYYGLSSSIEFHALKQTHQMQDWRIRPLTLSMILYGVSDVHYLLPLRKLLIRDFCRRDYISLLDDDDTIEVMGKDSLKGFESFIRPPLPSLDRQESITSIKTDGFFTPLEGEALNTWEGSMTVQPKLWSITELRSNSELIDVLCVSQERCLRVWKEENEPLERNETFIRLCNNSRLSRSSSTWTESNMALYQVLHQYRQTISRQHGLNPSMIIPLDLLVEIAYRKPRSIFEIRQLSYILPAFLVADENLKHLHEIVEIVSLVPSSETSTSLPFSTFSEFANMCRDHSTKKDEGVSLSHLNVLRWTLVSAAALSWLMVVLKKQHR